MAFWGVEVKPGKPFAHSFDRARGRLRISQATLGIGSATNKSIVQCNVGNKSPVFLCALLPDKTESCHLDLEFEEADEILFSVIGPRSVHLTGYYLGSCRRSDLDDDTESYGEDIANTDTDESIHGSKEDEYEDSFIDDGAPEVFPPSPISNDDAPDEEMLDNKKPTKRRGIHKKLKKKYRSIDSDDDNDLQPKIAVNNNKDVSGLESEDEDNFPISSLYKSQTTEAGKKYDGEMGQSVSNKVEDDVPHIIEKIAKDNVVVVDTPPDRGMNMPSKAMLPSDGLVLKNDLELKNEKKERPGKGESLKTEGITCHETLEEVKLQCTVEKGDDISWNHCIKIGLGQKSATDKGSDQPGHSMHPSDDVDLEKHTKAKRKRKRTKEGKTFEDDSDNHGISLENDKALQDTTENKKPATEKLDDSLLPSTEAASGNVAKPKKRRKKSASKKTSIESGADCNHVSEYVKSNENKGVDLHTRSEEEKLPRNE
ncbi:Peptidylprolyl isomerase [Bertholletia excelsa]